VYLDLFKLREKPFNVTPDPHFLYMSPSHQEAFANLLYGIRERQGFILVTGEVGTGKTTLVHNLLSTLGDEVQTVFVYHTGLQFTDLLEIIHQELDIPIAQRSLAGMLQSLNRYLIAQLAKGRIVALIIDEGQNLDPEILENLRLLSNLETAKDKLLQIVLVGQPELAAKLELPQLRQLSQRIATRSEILPLLPDESRAYILHRLAVAGAGAAPIFSEEAIKLLIENARGIPRRINILCDNAMLLAYAEGDRLVRDSYVREAIADLKRGVPPGRRAPTPALPSARAPERSRAAWPSHLPRSALAAGGAVLLLALLWGSYLLGNRAADRALPVREPLPAQTAQPRVAKDPLAAPGPSSSGAAAVYGQIASASPPADDTPAPPLSEAPAAAPSEPPAAATPASDTLPAAYIASAPKEPVAVPVQSAPPSAAWLVFRSAVSREQLQAVLDRCERRPYQVQPGDTYIGAVYNATGRADPLILELLRDMNPQILNPDHIEPFWVIFLPALKEGQP
jgi:general secretion pathway protein A